MPYPPGGVIYCTTPVRLVNAAKLPGKLTIVSCSNVYTKGDVNKKYATLDDKNDNIVTKQPMAIMTTARIYHLSGNWSDSKATATSGVPGAGDDRLYFW